MMIQGSSYTKYPKETSFESPSNSLINTTSLLELSSTSLKVRLTAAVMHSIKLLVTPEEGYDAHKEYQTPG